MTTTRHFVQCIDAGRELAHMLTFRRYDDAA